MQLVTLGVFLLVVTFLLTILNLVRSRRTNNNLEQESANRRENLQDLRSDIEFYSGRIDNVWDSLNKLHDRTLDLTKKLKKRTK